MGNVNREPTELEARRGRILTFGGYMMIEKSRSGRTTFNKNYVAEGSHPVYTDTAVEKKSGEEQKKTRLKIESE
jgi:hypothetical protein